MQRPSDLRDEVPKCLGSEKHDELTINRSQRVMQRTSDLRDEVPKCLGSEKHDELTIYRSQRIT